MIDRLRAHWNRNLKLRFLFVGGWNTVFGYACFLALYAAFGTRLHYLLIAIVAHVVNVCQAFALHRLMVFRSRGAWLREFVRFNLAQLTILAGCVAALWLLVSVVHLDPPIAQAIVTIGAVVTSYLGHRHFSFAA